MGNGAVGRVGGCVCVVCVCVCVWGGGLAYFSYVKVMPLFACLHMQCVCVCVCVWTDKLPVVYVCTYDTGC